MDQFQEILRLFVSQALALSLLFLLIPLRKPVRMHVIIIIISSLIITSIKAIVMLFLEREMYTGNFFTLQMGKTNFCACHSSSDW